MRINHAFGYRASKGRGVRRGAPTRVEEVLRDRVRFLERNQSELDGGRWNYTSLLKTTPYARDLPMNSLDRERTQTRSWWSDPGFTIDIKYPSKTTAFFVSSTLTLLGRYSIGAYLRIV